MFLGYRALLAVVTVLLLRPPAPAVRAVERQDKIAYTALRPFLRKPAVTKRPSREEKKRRSEFHKQLHKELRMKYWERLDPAVNSVVQYKPERQPRIDPKRSFVVQEAIPRLVKLEMQQSTCTLTAEQSEAFDRRAGLQLLCDVKAVFALIAGTINADGRFEDFKLMASQEQLPKQQADIAYVMSLLRARVEPAPSRECLEYCSHLAELAEQQAVSTFGAAAAVQRAQGSWGTSSTSSRTGTSRGGTSSRSCAATSGSSGGCGPPPSTTTATPSSNSATVARQHYCLRPRRASATGAGLVRPRIVVGSQAVGLPGFRWRSRGSPVRPLPSAEETADGFTAWEHVARPFARVRAKPPEPPRSSGLRKRRRCAVPRQLPRAGKSSLSRQSKTRGLPPGERTRGAGRVVDGTLWRRTELLVALEADNLVDAFAAVHEHVAQPGVVNDVAKSGAALADDSADVAPGNASPGVKVVGERDVVDLGLVERDEVVGEGLHDIDSLVNLLLLAVELQLVGLLLQNHAHLTLLLQVADDAVFVVRQDGHVRGVEVESVLDVSAQDLVDLLGALLLLAGVTGNHEHRAVDGVASHDDGASPVLDGGEGGVGEQQRLLHGDENLLGLLVAVAKERRHASDRAFKGALLSDNVRRAVVAEQANVLGGEEAAERLLGEEERQGLLIEVARDLGGAEGSDELLQALDGLLDAVGGGGVGGLVVAVDIDVDSALGVLGGHVEGDGDAHVGLDGADHGPETGRERLANQIVVVELDAAGLVLGQGGGGPGGALVSDTRLLLLVEFGHLLVDVVDGEVHSVAAADDVEDALVVEGQHAEGVLDLGEAGNAAEGLFETIKVRVYPLARVEVERFEVLDARLHVFVLTVHDQVHRADHGAAGLRRVNVDAELLLYAAHVVVRGVKAVGSGHYDDFGSGEGGLVELLPLVALQLAQEAADVLLLTRDPGGGGTRSLAYDGLALGDLGAVSDDVEDGLLELG
ncbi:signal peptide containing protein [Babesia caballi]|uniref:Signal peptide containing protein n=1 Tax=Babesia caballi TaxID=5871 RepID=A0AAV4LS86_BABCB|nr:signal peptide containing protein [Babesia caballi]